MSKKALGKGLNALFSEDPVDQENDIKEVDIYHIQPDKINLERTLIRRH